MEEESPNTQTYLDFLYGDVEIGGATFRVADLFLTLLGFIIAIIAAFKM